MTYIRDHNREIFEARKAKIKEIQQTLNAPFDEEHSRSQSRDFEARKAKIKEIQQTLNAPFDEERIKVDLFDQYYNMREVIEKICPLSKLLNKQWKNCQFNQLLNLFAVERMAQNFLFRDSQISLLVAKICMAVLNLFHYKPWKSDQCDY